MKLVLSHSSALDCIRALRWRRADLPNANIKSLADTACSLKNVNSITIPAFEQSQARLEVLVSTAGKAQKSREHICRVLNSKPISGMFCRIADNAYTASPEMTFVQMATRLDTVELLLLGMELCGTYARSPYSDRFEQREPVTTRNRLLSFCERARGVRGAATAAKAARWIADGSNSPAERQSSCCCASPFAWEATTSNGRT